MIHEAGIAGCATLISTTAKWGDPHRWTKIVDKHVHQNMAMALGQSAPENLRAEFIREMRTGGERNAIVRYCKGGDVTHWKKPDVDCVP